MAKKELKKSVLKKIPVQMATGFTISQAKRNDETIYYMKAETKIIDHKRMLVVHVYHRDHLRKDLKDPLFRVFLTKKDYLSQYYVDGVPMWRTGRIESLMDYFYYSYRACCCDGSSRKAIESYIPEYEGSSIKKIIKVQEQIRLNKRNARYEKEMKDIDQRMRLIRDLPKDFIHWVDKNGLPYSRYIYYQYSSRKYMDGYCTHCEQEVKVTGVKHRSEGICPNCGVSVTFLAESRAKHILDYGVVAYLQKTKEGFVIRHFSVKKRYGKDYRNPELYVFELRRDFFDGDRFDFYEWREFKQSGKVRWCDGLMKFFPEDAMIYTKNLDIALKGTRFQYCALKEYAMNDKERGIRPYAYLCEYTRKPYIEYLVKLGLYRLVYEICSPYHYTQNLHTGGNSITTILGVEKQDIRLIQEVDMSMNQLGVYRRLLLRNIRPNAEQFLYFYHRYYNQTDTIFKVLEYTTLHKAERYCERYVDDKHNFNNILHTWKDYISFCEELGYDLKNSFVLFPGKLHDAHNEVVKEVTKLREKAKKEQIKAEEKKARKLLRDYKEIYPWSDGELSIVVPKELFEIKEEGYALHHCVGTYTTKVANEQSIILFIRRMKQPEKPFYTMEIRDGRIIQVRGYSNHDMTEEVKDFVERYKKEVLDRIGMKEAV